MYRELVKHCHGIVNWTAVPGFTRLSKVYVQGLIVTSKLYSNIINTYIYIYNTFEFINAVSQLFENVPRTANQLGLFCSALLCNTDAMHSEQVQLCFDTMREWIGILERDKYEPLNGLLPDSWCHETFIDAANKILHQDDYQVICVLLTFILHHAHLFQDDILIKENFRPLFCHWNALVRKYFHRVILYTTNRMGFFEDDSYGDVKENDFDLVEDAKKLRITFNHIFQIINKKSFFFFVLNLLVCLLLFVLSFKLFKKKKSFGNYPPQQKIVSKFPVPKKEKKNKDEGSTGNHNENSNKKDGKIVWRFTDMRIQQRVDTDHDILTALAVEVINLNKHRDAIPAQYQRYINLAGYEFLEACNEYKEAQLSKIPHKLGEVGIPTLGYRVLTIQDLDEKDKIS
ncbi:hypothetical protein RFI_08111 [Reticulomyxa filosa]|uniref:Uncharacterized protein n=1 Tax=Reticulomyxa filosa TaxID=46433 RepID=X6NRV8_RETFI|nr:hypothetical protein RFI_08111 [Reticulomyxa filosa]|eukprot:ETO29015.1 hypothetical protein RFI_08111 [Reticulomyxa filosa]